MLANCFYLGVSGCLQVWAPFDFLHAWTSTFMQLTYYVSCMFPSYFCTFGFCYGDLGLRNFCIFISANYFPPWLFPRISPKGSFHLCQVQINVLFTFSFTMGSFPAFNSLIYLDIIVNFLLERSIQKYLNKLEWGGHTLDLSITPVLGCPCIGLSLVRPGWTPAGNAPGPCTSTGTRWLLARTSFTAVNPMATKTARLSFVPGARGQLLEKHLYHLL